MLNDNDFKIIEGALLDAELITKNAMNLWAGRGREKYYRDEMIAIQEVSAKIRKMKIKLFNTYEEDLNDAI